MNYLKNIAFFLFLLFSISCTKERIPQVLEPGTWRGQLTTQNNDIPFNFEVLKSDGAYSINLINGDETIEIDDVEVKGDSVYFDLHIFDISIRARIENAQLTGTYTKNYAENYTLPFQATYGEHTRFDHKNSSAIFNGTWETKFYTKEGKETDAIGIFKTEKNILKGTFLTKTGDYRYLDGYTKKDTMYLYSFDGNHIYKFRAFKENDSILKGEFWSGKTGYYTFTSKRNENAKLPDANSLTYLKDGYDKIEFTFQGLDGKPVSLSDEKYQNKIIIIQILGTWCPNCMDETKFLAPWYDKNKEKGVEIIGLAYENKKNGKADFEYARDRVQKMKEKLHVNYDIIIAGTSSSEAASESLPMLNKVMSFPTSIIIDKKGKVRRIHTGFSGPATGIYYEEFVTDFNSFMNELLQE